MTIRLLTGDVREKLAELPDESVHCVVTSPPYWGLRDYGTAQWEGGDPGCDHRQGRPGSGRADGVVDDRMQRNRDGVGAMGGGCGKCGARRIDQQIGLEADFRDYIATMVAVFREVRRVLRHDGTVWLNLGDSYASDGARANNNGTGATGLKNDGRDEESRKRSNAKLKTIGLQLPAVKHGLKPKDLCGIPWRVAFALQEAGWWLRSDIIWAKPNPMPESVTDRPTKAHEYLFLLTKAERYYYDAAAIAEQAEAGSCNPSPRKAELSAGKLVDQRTAAGFARGVVWGNTRNKRSVWEIAAHPFSEAHFATFPPALIEPCIKAGCPEGGTVLDPFGGAGTTGLVADRLGRNAILIELNPEYVEMARRRITVDCPLFADVA